jgi:hypothetical protein
LRSLVLYHIPMILDEPETEPHVFPTASRDRPNTLVSYPVGAEILSRSLDGIPQHLQVTCSFYAASNPHHDARREKIHVLHAMYRKIERNFHHSGDAAQRGVFDARWSITVFCVARALRHEVRQALMEVGLPNHVRPWFMAQARIGGQSGEASLVLEYNTLEKTLVITPRSDIKPQRSR